MIFDLDLWPPDLNINRGNLLAKTGHWQGVYHGLFNLYWLIRAVKPRRKRKLHNEKLLFTL